ncbi:gamma-glutamyltransferase family protein [Dethiosulfatarculus sandiegensis]|uniref:gamma-glutamyltransferase family protein n=1 Tax=Dethiosulfatarculus sandiegensis TaxID=1429043 RepID=UPI00069746D9|nr:gamma-glutamyltransferase [Dethiosulfatarculus sandiegensis]
MIDFESIQSAFTPTPDQTSCFSKGGMVSSAFPAASKAGALMLKKGGNAADAACATALALSVGEPQASGLGGQSMVLLHLNGQTLALDGSGPIPALAKPDKFGPNDTKVGYRATTVPTTPAVLAFMHKKYGKLTLEQVISPAIELAKEGYTITPLQSFLQKRELENFFLPENPSAARYFLKNGNTPYEPGEIFCQPHLAGLLEHLAQNGLESFYQGEIAQAIDRDMRQNKGFLRAEDLAETPWPKIRKPVTGSFRGIELVSTPPPTSGRILLFILKLLEAMPPEFHLPLTEKSMAYFCEVMRKGLMEREEHPYWPDQYDQEKDPVLSSPELPQKISRWILSRKTPDMSFSEPGWQGGETTHLSVMDNEGNAVGLTQSVNLVYASKTACEGLGFLYNNYLLDTQDHTPGHPNYRAPGGMAWSSVAATMAMVEGKPWLVTGSPGSERIISALARFFLYLADGGLSIARAQAQPRIHCATNRTVSLEAGGFKDELVQGLAHQGYTLDQRRPRSFYLGAVHTVLRQLDGKGFQGAAEFRRDGIAAGPDQV